MNTVREEVDPRAVHEALLWEQRPDGTVVCNLCAHRCRIRPGLRGICGVRENHDGRLETLVFDRVIAADVDPVEKKPFFHFLPGSLAYSIATIGCNFHCLFCRRRGFAVLENSLRDGRCPACRTVIAGVWE